MKRTWAVWLLALPLVAAEGPEFKVRVGSATVQLPLERYVAAVLAGESSVFRSDEALKAMSVAARTYAVRMRGRHSAEGFDFCATTHCQHLDLAAITPRLEGIAQETAGELLWFQGKPAFACYTRDCGGRSEDAAAVWPEEAAPYLKSHDDPYCVRAGGAPPGAAWQWNADPRQVADALGRALLRAPHKLERISIESATPSGRARTLVLEGAGERVRIAAGSFRLAMGREVGWNTVRSDRYRVGSSGGRLVFDGTGSGHGVGLCQRGAGQMGVEGHTWREILAFYYPGTVAGLTAQGIAWQRIAGESVSLWTTRPEADGALLAAAERQLRAATERTNLTAPGKIEIRVYPDLDTFRNATGEPGWVAARTEGRRVHLQPAEVLRSRGALDSTLHHELLHVLIEAHAAPGLPVWFREGLVEYLDRPAPAASGAARVPSDADLQQTADAARARQAYRDAAGAVAALAQRYGEATLFDWLRTGLPAAVKNASSEAPARGK
ncbi:MAG: SpoIID/LytB domain-containing protein [Bryobacteraceae bacterium]